MDRAPSLAEVFVRPDLTAADARAVADSRLNDAEYLRSSRHDRHANGAIYLAGLALDLLLKACALEDYPFLRSAAEKSLSRANRHLWSLVYREHDLETLWAALPRRQALVSARSRAGRARADRGLKDVLAWSIHVRYSPRSTTIEEADTMVGQIAGLMDLL